MTTLFAMMFSTTALMALVTPRAVSWAASAFASAIVALTALVATSSTEATPSTFRLPRWSTVTTVLVTLWAA